MPIVFWLRLMAAWMAAFCLPAYAERAGPFVIAPMIEGIGYCAAGAKAGSIPAALAVCTSEKNPSGPLLQETLNRLEPGGAKGKVQVGYTVGINLMGFANAGDLMAHLVKIQALILSVDRPVVLYLMGNQFAAPPPNVSLDNRSYAVFSDQTVPKEHYFVNSINAWTLETDPTLEANRIRFGSLQMVGRWYGVLPAALQAKIIGITLAGELHHFFPDFANGLGRYDNIKVTDYSPASVRSFQNWLRTQHESLADLNQHLGTTFASFDVITPPARDIRRDKLDDFSQHFDAYAHGKLPVEGWLAPMPAGHNINIYLNGEKLGEAEYGLSRQDVYESVPSLKSAGVGFRYWLDFSALPRGVHTIQVVLSGGGKQVQIARRNIVLMGNSQETPPKFAAVRKFKPAKHKSQFWLDRPRDMQDYYFNPLAKSWGQFRNQQVTQAYHHWFEQATKSSLPSNKLYSHQIAVATVGSWNPLLAGSDDSVSGLQPYKKGINLYGAALNVNMLRRHYLTPRESFAVPEFHTQAWKDPQAPLQVLTAFNAAGATFMSPYFMTLLPAELRQPGNPHDKFRVAPDNPVYGSNHLYQAIVQAASH